MYVRQGHVRRSVLIAFLALSLSCKKEQAAPATKTNVKLTDPSGEPTMLRYAIAKRDTRGNGREIFLSEKPIACDVAKPQADVMFSIWPGPPGGYQELMTDAYVTTRVKERTATRAEISLKQTPNLISINEEWTRVLGAFEVQDCPDVVAAETQPTPGSSAPLTVTVPGMPPLAAGSPAALSLEGIGHLVVNLGGERMFQANLLGARDADHHTMVLTPQPVQATFSDHTRPGPSAYGWIRFLELDFVKGSKFRAEIGVKLHDQLEAKGIIEGVVGRAIRDGTPAPP